MFDIHQNNMSCMLVQILYLITRRLNFDSSVMIQVPEKELFTIIAESLNFHSRRLLIKHFVIGSVQKKKKKKEKKRHLLILSVGV